MPTPRVPSCSAIALALGLLALWAGPACAEYFIWGTDMSATYNHVQVWGEGDVPILDAAVSVNGVALARVGDSSTYSGLLDPPVPPGDTLSLVVEVGGETITAADAVPDPPTLTGPAGGSEYTTAELIPVAWTCPSDPQTFRIWALWESTGKTWDVGGTQRSYEIPAGELPVGTTITLQVFAYNDGTFTGPVQAGSEMNIRGDDGSEATITVTSSVPAVPATWGALKALYP